MAISDFLDHIAKEKRFSVHTQLAYKNDLESFRQFISEEFAVDLQEVSSKMVRNWFAALLEQELEPRTIRRKASALRSYYKYCIKNGELKGSPLEGLVMPKMAKRLPKFVEEKNLMAYLLEVFEAPEQEEVVQRFVVEILYSTGMRLSELIELKTKDVDLVNLQLKVTGKRNKERVIPFSLAFSETLKNYLSYRNIASEYLVCTLGGKKAYPKYIYRLVNSCLEKISTVKQKSPHVLRHTFATHMLNNGAELNAIKEVLGHANLSATEVYTHNSLEKIKLVYKQAHPRA